MTTAASRNARIVRQYLHHLVEAEGLTERTVDQTARAIAAYEAFTEGRDFAKFRKADAVAFKRALFARDGRAPGDRSSRSTVATKVRQVRKFFNWLAGQPGYKTAIHRTDLDYFNVSAREARLAREPGDQPTPTLEQIRQVILNMPSDTLRQKRDRALVACFALTGVRVSACISLRLKHVLPDRSGIHQDAREVRTKFSKSSTIFFFPVGDDIRTIFLTYVEHLREQLLWGEDDPLFPRTRLAIGRKRSGELSVDRVQWKTPGPVWDIFRRAFAAAQVPYFTPHSFRRTLARLGERVCRSPEALKSWSQNLSHDDVTTTLTSYGHVPLHRQREIMGGFRGEQETDEEAVHRYGPMLSDPLVQQMLDRMMKGPAL